MRHFERSSNENSGSRRVNRSAIRIAMERFVASRGGSSVPPTPDEVMRYLQGQVEAMGARAAHADFAYLQKASAEVWGTRETSFFARILREERVSRKPHPKSPWDQAAWAVSKLPDAWQVPMRDFMERSRNVQLGSRGSVWSASRIKAVCEALARWCAHCDAFGQDAVPTGAKLNEYASVLITNGVSRNTVGDYIARILAGNAVISGLPASSGAQVVLAEYRSRKSAPVTKAAAQIVGASAIFDLGCQIFGTASARSTRGSIAAREARDGILLMLAAAFGERATALSYLAFGSTLELGARPEVRVRLPGHALKMSERKKASRVRAEILRNEPLFDALWIYRAEFLPILGAGNSLFPSLKSLDAPLTPRALGRIVGNLTMQHFNVRVSLHRIRDNIATEASETAANGLMIASGVLGHADARTTLLHYDRSKGTSAMRDFAEFTEQYRSEGGRVRL